MTLAPTCLPGAVLDKAILNPSNRAKESNGASRQLEMSPEDKKTLRAHIDKIKQALAATTRHAFDTFTYDFTAMDRHFMSRLVESANLSKPGLNLQYAPGARVGSELLRTAVENGASSGRYIVNLAYAMVHFCAVDYRLIDGVPSFICFEPVGASIVSGVLKIELSEIPKLRFSIVSMDIQRSRGDCGIFSLAFAKKLHQEQDWLLSLHEKNAAGELQLSEEPWATSETDRLDLPPSLYKHSQTRERSAEYLGRNPGKENAAVNKKNETLLEFQQRHLRVLSSDADCFEGARDFLINFSIQNKRLREYEQLDARAVEVQMTEAGSQ